MSEVLQFISASVIQRLKDGSFVPQRRSKAGPIKDRRNTISPLAVTKRCVRYDHHVFLNRKPLVIEMAESLNSPNKKLILMGGVQGCGKTSLARGIIELMGGGKEQLLWFDVNTHTDFDEIIVFFMQYITYICSALSIENNEAVNGDSPTDPFQKLEALILKVAHIPLLIVIDNVEHIVDTQYQIRSFPLKETLNFLLSFPNIKMILCGERLPYADMSANASVITDIKLSGLNEKDVLKLLHPHPNELDQNVLIDLYQKTQGYPWLLKTIFHLNKKHTGELDSLVELNQLLATRKEENPSDAIIRFIYSHLTPEEQEVAQVLALIRHPADFETLLAISRYCKPGLAISSPDSFKTTLEKSILKPLMKRTFPPQSVLAHIKERHESVSQFQPAYELYRQVKRVFAMGIPSAERVRIHRLLQDFYLKEKNKRPDERVYPVKSKPLIAEAKYHGNASRERRSVFNDSSPKVDSKAYLYGGIKPLEARPLSSSQAKTPPDALLEELPEMSEPASIEPFSSVSLEELNLTDEEKALLRQGGAFKEVRQEDTDTPEESFEETPGDVNTEHLTPKTESDPPLTFFDHLREVAEETLPSVRPEPEQKIPVFPVSTPEPAPVSEETRNRVSSNLNIEETDPVEKQILQHLATAVANHNRPQMLTHLLRLARHRGSKGLLPKAEECLHKALELHKDARPVELADIYSQLGSIHKKTYRHNSALDYLKKSITQYDQLNENTGKTLYEQGQLHENLGDIYAFRGQHHQAISSYYKGLEFFSQTPSTSDEQADLYFKLAQVYDVMGVPENAINYYEQSLSLDKRNQNELSAAATLVNMASLHQEVGRLDKALDCFNESLTYDRRNDYPEGLYKTLEKVAMIHIQNQSWQKAEQCYQQAMAVALKENNTTWKANTYLKLGNLYQRLNNWKKAWDQFKLAQDMAELADLSEESQILLRRKVEEAARAIHTNPADFSRPTQ